MSTGALWEPAAPAADYVTVTPSGGIASTDLQSALEELDTEKLAIADIDDAPVNGVTTAPISSNWAYDHAANATTHGSGAATDGFVLTADGSGGTAWEAVSSSASVNKLIQQFNGGF